MMTKTLKSVHVPDVAVVGRFMDASRRLTDAAEDLAEEMGWYRSEFVKSIKNSVRDMKRGKGRKVESLMDLR